MKLTVVGAQRSGTRYLATVLFAAGVDAMHEGNVPGTGWRVHDPRNGPRFDHDVDVCWHNAWWLDTTLAGVPVVHLVRDPLASIASSVVRRTFTRPRPSGRWAIDRLPELRGGAGVERAVRYWCVWNELIEPHADRRLRVEDVTTGELAGILDDADVAYDLNDLAAAVHDTPTDVNRNETRRPLRWDDLPDSVRDRAATLAARYGYLPAREETA